MYTLIYAFILISLSSLSYAATNNDDINADEAINLSSCSMENALTAFQETNFSIATIGFIKCLDTPEQNVESQFYLGLIARNEQRLEDSETWLKSAVQADPENINYKLNLAVTLEWSGQLSAALKVYNSILEKQPNHTIATIAKARVLNWKGDIAQSIALYRSIIKDDANNLGAITGLGYALLADLQLEASAKAFNKVLAVQPNAPSPIEGLEMLSNTFIHKLEFNLYTPSSADNISLDAFALNYKQSLSRYWRWGLKASKEPNDIDAYSIYTDYNLNDRIALFTSAEKKWVEGTPEYKLKAEVNYMFDNKNKIIASTTPLVREDEHISTLNSVSLVFDTDYQWKPTLQYFYNVNHQGDDSRTILLSGTKSYGQNNFIQLGASVEKQADSTKETLFASHVYYFSKQLGTRMSLANNFATNKPTINLGVIYEY